MKKSNKKVAVRSGLKNVKETKKTSRDNRLHERIEEIKFSIKAHEDSIERLLAFACGEKKIKNTRLPLSLSTSHRIDMNNHQLIKTLSYLRIQIASLKKELPVVETLLCK